MQKSKLDFLCVCLCFACAVFLFCSCEDKYDKDEREPSWLGSSLYDYLQDDGHYTCYLALINDLGDGNKEMLSRTGSKTLFPANDEAFARYFKRMGMSGGNGVALIHRLSDSEKRVLFNTTMLNMAYLDYMLANTPSNDEGTMGEGLALRRTTSLSYLDSIPFVEKEKLPQTIYWQRFAERDGAYLVDNTSRQMVHFTPRFMGTAGITEEDWGVIAKGVAYDQTGFYVNGVRVQEKNKNITCKNGYIHIADEVIEPLRNMSEVILSDRRTALFGELMDKFSAPYYNEDIAQRVNAFYAGNEPSDSVFVKRYFNDADLNVDPEGQSMSEYGTLFYDPAENSWRSQQDMGVMFVPTDAAMNSYWESQQGRFLKDVYGTWQNVPTDVLAAFIKNHQRRSFLSSLPHDWDIMTDENSFYMNVKGSDVDTSYVACNGMVYLTNVVYPPIDYQCVYGPSLTSDSTTLMKSAIKDTEMKFYLYLRSLQNQYNLLIPTNEAMKEYREPISWAIWANGGSDKREIWSFKMVDDKIYADIYNVTQEGTKGTFKRTIGSTSSDRSKIKNRLNDILDMHIVVADNEKEPLSGFMDSGEMQYALTKGGTILKVEGAGEQMQVAGGGDVELGLPHSSIVQLPTGAGCYYTDNGHAYFMNRILQDPFKSVYSAMQEHEAYSDFFALLMGSSSVFSYFQEDDDVVPVFDQNAMSSSSGIGQVVTSFNNYRYTILIPSNEALKEAFEQDAQLWTWDEIDAEDNPATKKSHCLYLLNFLKYHFIDGIVPVSGVSFGEKEYETAARDANNQFVRILVSSDGTGLQFKNEQNNASAQVITENSGDYNVLTRDYIVDNKDYTLANNILASSRAVLHLVNHAVNYQKK